MPRWKWRFCMHILAIETSCDETAAAVIEKNGSNIKILSNVIASQIDLHKKFGGVFPEIASRAHAEKIITVSEEALKENKDIDVIAVTTGPGLIGSLLVGVNFAKTLAFSKKLPIIGVNHWLGHIYSNWAKKPYPTFPALVLIVSGGHTGLVLMKSHNKIFTLGETLDDAAGEAFDKVSNLLGLGYPGGPAISAAAEKYKASSETKSGSQAPQEVLYAAPVERISFCDERVKLPRPMLGSKDYNFSFSGLKTAVLYEFKKHHQNNLVKFEIASEFQQAVIDVLIGKTTQAAYEFKPKSICLCGGVSANKELREQMEKAVAALPWKTTYFVPPINLSTDNAAMIGLAAAYHLNQKTTWDKIIVDSNLKL